MVEIATVPSQRSWVTGEVVTAAYMNSNIRDAVNFLLSPPTCQVRQTVAQSIPTNGSPLNFDAEDFDNDNMHSTVSNTNRITAVTPGRYQLSGGSSFDANASARKGNWWRVNGGNINASGAVGPSSAANDTTTSARVISIYLNAGDYVELYAYQETGGAVNSFVGASQSQSSALVRYIGNA